jgi:glycosyltransferase involved in cell wall biosynthesis
MTCGADASVRRIVAIVRSIVAHSSKIESPEQATDQGLSEGESGTKPVTQRPLRIGFLTNEYPTADSGGIGSYVRQMAHTMVTLGHSCCVLLCAPSDESLTWDGPVQVHTIGLPEDASYLPLPLGKRSGIVFARRLATLISHHHLDVFEAPEYLGLTAFLSLFKPSGLRVVVRLHTCSSIVRMANGYRPMSLRNRLKDSLQDWLERRAIQTADSVTAISTATVDLTTKMLRLRRQDLVVTDNPVNDLYFSSRPESSISIEPVVLFAGRLEWRKGPDILIRALPSILRHFPNTRFCFAGCDTPTGPDGSSMYAYLSSLLPEGARTHVEFTGFLKPEQLLEKYHQSTVCVFPSRWEGFGLAPAEAMACGKPVIVSDTSGFREIVSGTVDGLFIKPDDPETLAETIKVLLSDCELRQRLGTAARHTAFTRFHGTAVGRSTLKIYRDAIAGAK